MIASNHLNKIFLALALTLTFSAIGNALICNYCMYTTVMPKAQQVCGNATQANCTTGYCYAASYTNSNGVKIVLRSCDDPNDRACPDAEKTCETRTSKNSLKSCAGMCCTTHKCNNYTPDSATGIIVSKSTFCVMVIAAFLLA